MQRRCFLLQTTAATAAAAFQPALSGAESAARRHPRQSEFFQWRFGMFLHFGMGTFAGREWATGYEDPDLFAPARLNCGQWADAAAGAGVGYAVLTAKHTGGWCLWPSKHTAHGVQSFRKFRNGRGDIVREYVDAFRARGIRIGIYYCFPGDYVKPATRIPDGKPDLHGLPPEAQGNAVEFMKKQLAELIDYRPDLFWIDQAVNKYTAPQWPEIKEHIHRLHPPCLIVANNARDLKSSDVLSYEFPWRPILPAEDNRDPAEVSDTIQMQSRWFWHPGLELLGVDTMAERYRTCRSRHAVYLLNVPPNRDGLIPGEYVQRLQALGKAIAGK